MPPWFDLPSPGTGIMALAATNSGLPGSTWIAEPGWYGSSVVTRNTAGGGLAQPTGDARIDRPAALLLVSLMVLFGILGLRVDRAPNPVSASAPPDQFSAARAREHLREITRAPHPVGSAAHARVRDYLIGALRDMGLEPQVQHTTAISPFAPNYAAEVYNVMARIRGTASTGAILLLAHYDTVIGSFGASDDGAGVAAILETVRALGARGPLRNDLIVLLSDAEELGLLGAAAFVEEHPWLSDVELVLNIDARGSRGVSYMFQTIGPNGSMIQALAASTPRPVANTVMQEVYERMPNGTDLSVFADADLAGMDFAYLRALSHYHTPLDNFENQDPASLQHHGSYLLGLVTAFGASDLLALDAPARTYFNFGSLAFVHYPESWVLPLAVLVLLVTIGFLVHGTRRGQLRLTRVPVGLVAAVAAVGGSVLMARAGWNLLARRSESVAWDPSRLFYDSTPYLLAFCAATVTIVSLVMWFASRWATAAELAAPPLLAWALAGLAAAVYAPGVSYLFVWPALGGLVAAVVVMRDSMTPWPRALVMGMAAAPALLVAFPWVVWLEISMTLRFVAAIVGLLAFVLVLLTSHIDAALRAWTWRLPVAGALITLAAVFWALSSPEYDEVRKRPTALHYLADLDTGEAYWVSSDPEVHEWTARVLGDDPERGELPAFGRGGTTWLRRTQLRITDGPTVTVMSDEIDHDRRVLELRIDVPTETFRTNVEALSTGLGIEAITLNRRWELDPPTVITDEPVRLLTFMGAPQDGFTLRLILPLGSALTLRLRTTQPGLPIELAPRPADIMSRGDVTILQRTMVIAARERGE